MLFCNTKKQVLYTYFLPMYRILANDGIHPTGKKLLEDAGCEVVTENIPQDALLASLNNFDAIIVRSATKVRKELIDACPNLKIIARAGVGMDNIDVEYARSIGRHVVNTPAASSRSVAELVFAHLLSLSRSLYLANREMPSTGGTAFKGLKKSYAKGVELRSKTLGVIGLGRIGCEVIKMAVGLEMNIVAHDPFVDSRTLNIHILGEPVTVEIKSASMDQLLTKADFITVHVPNLGTPILAKSEFDNMKDGVILVNAARGGVVDEEALIDALDAGKVKACGLDVFVNEPTPDARLLSRKEISLSPHIGASTLDAQENIGKELAKQIKDIFKLS